MHYTMVVVKNEFVPLKYDVGVEYCWFVAIITIIIAGYSTKMMDDMYLYRSLYFEM